MRLTSKPARTGARADGDRSRNSILAAALRLFSAHGFDRASIRQIAAAARCNLAAIRYYFGDKAGLIIAVAEHTISQAIEGGAHPVVDPTADPRAALRAYVLWVLRTARKQRGSTSRLPALLLSSTALDGALGDKLAARLGEPVRAGILGLIDQLHPGPLPPDLREHAFIFIFNTCSQFVHGGPLLCRMGVDVPRDDAGLDALAERLTNFIIGGLDCMIAHDKAARTA